MGEKKLASCCKRVVTGIQGWMIRNELIYTGRGQPSLLRVIGGFLYGLILGLVFYELILVDLQIAPLWCMIMGGVITLMLGLGNALSVQIRCISLLTFPSFCGRAGRDVLKALVLAYVIAGPIENLVVNGREVVRVFSCSCSLTYNLTKTRTDLMFKPFQDALLQMKADTNEVKETMQSIRDVVAPITGEIEGEEEMRRIREDNDYMDNLHNDSKRSEELDNKYRSKADESEQQRYERKYAKKAEARCEDVLSRGSTVCRDSFANTYDKCYAKVSWMAAWLLCWPMKLTFVCNIVEALGGEQICNPSNQVEPGFGESYAYLKRADVDMKKEFREVKVQYQVVKMKPWLDFRDASDTARSVLSEFQQKRDVLDFLLLCVKRLLAFVFIKIILAALSYHESYLSDIAHDNIYVTRYFRRIDARRRKRGQSFLLPLRKAERTVYVDPSSPLPAAQEKGALLRKSLKLILELATVTTFVMTDRLFYESLDLVQRHAHIDYTQEGSHDLKLEVKGTGMIANLVRSIVKDFNVKKRVKMIHSNRACLPRPHNLERYYLYKIYGTYLGIWLLVLLEAYTQRLRRLFCSYFYPKREKRRVLFTYNELLKKRIGFAKFMKTMVRRKVKEHQLSLNANIFLTMRVRYAWACGWLVVFPMARRACLLCEATEDNKSRDKGCPDPACQFYTCPECWADVDRTCYACAPPAADSEEEDDEEVVVF